MVVDLDVGGEDGEGLDEGVVAGALDVDSEFFGEFEGFRLIAEVLLDGDSDLVLVFCALEEGAGDDEAVVDEDFSAEDGGDVDVGF